MQKIILKLEEENLKLKDDCNNFLKKNEELKKHIDDLQDDKQRLSVSYDQLLDMQNKLVKFDLIKQENKLRVSTTES